MPDYLITTRKLHRGAFAAEPGPTRFLKIAANESPNPGQAIKRKSWLAEVLSLAHTHQDPHTGEDCGDIVVFVHGYNTLPSKALRDTGPFTRALPALPSKVRL